MYMHSVHQAVDSILILAFYVSGYSQFIIYTAKFDVMYLCIVSNSSISPKLFSIMFFVMVYVTVYVLSCDLGWVGLGSF